LIIEWECLDDRAQLIPSNKERSANRQGLLFCAFLTKLNHRKDKTASTPDHCD